MMRERRVGQEALFYEFSLERHVPEGHLLRAIGRFIELDGLRQELARFYSELGRPSIDPEPKVRATSLARSPRPSPTRPRAASAKRSKCSSE
jgi:transposase